MKTRVGDIEVSYSARGIPSFQVEMWHDGLKRHRLIKGSEQEIVRRKVGLQLAEWEDKWQANDAKDKDRINRLNQKLQQEEKKALAARRTSDAVNDLEALDNLLIATLSINDVVDWEDLKDTSAFSEPPPQKPPLPPKPNAQEKPVEPKSFDEKYKPKFGILDWLIPSRKTAKIYRYKEHFLADYAAWEDAISRADAAAREVNARWQHKVSEVETIYKNETFAWEARKEYFLKAQSDANSAIDRQQTLYFSGDPQTISEYCDLVLSRSKYPEYFPREFDLNFDQASKMLVIDYALPAPEDLPTLKAVKYVASRDEFDMQHITDSQLNKYYDDALYQVALRTVHEIFESDAISAIDIVVFNGFVTAIDKSIGKSVTACVLSLQTNKEAFNKINLASVDPKACFKSLKGVGSSRLSGLAAVPPIVNLKQDDSRFISSYEVTNGLDTSTNLAAMDWEDFEHLIRELFEQEFAGSGGEVKVTQASRDGGVDAVAFDPDPIRGGKIVIQAKRYTNTVGVSAVRDLYGTVMNEGANKGILVTTSDFGPDSYSFVNGKPLVLISGANLLFLLEKHGHKAKIDIREAKKQGLQ